MPEETKNEETNEEETTGMTEEQKKWLMWGGVGIVALSAIGGGVYFAQKNGLFKKLRSKFSVDE